MTSCEDTLMNTHANTTANTHANTTANEYNINQELSIFIPYIYPEQAEIEYVKNIFKIFNIAHVNHVEFKEISGGFEAYVFMNKWFNNFSVNYLQDMIINHVNGGRLVHDDPYYWILLPNDCLEENYTDEYKSQITQLRETNDSLIYHVNHLEEKIYTLENTLSESQWWIKQHNDSLHYLYNNTLDNTHENSCDNVVIDNQSFDCNGLKKGPTHNNTLDTHYNTEVKKQVRHNTRSRSQKLGTCGNITNAWEPSQPQVLSVKNEPTDIWIRRLRTRT